MKKIKLPAALKEISRLNNQVKRMTAKVEALKQARQELSDDCDGWKATAEGEAGVREKLEVEAKQFRSAEEVQYRELEQANKQIADLKAIIVKTTEAQAFMAQYL